MTLTICLLLAAWITALFTIPYKDWPAWLPFIGVVKSGLWHPAKEDINDSVFAIEWFDKGLAFGVGMQK